MIHAFVSSLAQSKCFSISRSRLVALLVPLLGLGVFFVAASASLGQTPKPSALPFEGSLDKVEVGTVGGWAWDASQPNSAIKVDIYDGEKLLATIAAETFREDLKMAQKGDGKHGFDFLLPKSLRDGQSHTISVKYSGTNSDLSGSPKTLLFPKL